MLRSCLLLLAALVLPAQGTVPPLTHEDIWLMKRVGAPKASPDGRWAVFPVTQPAYDAKEQATDLWLKRLDDDSPARQITFTRGAEGGAAWAPDSRRLAFTAKREGDEAAQVYLLDLAGGEAQRITGLTLGARQPRWSPDGTQVLFLSDVFPGAHDEAAIQKEAKARKERKPTGRAYDRFPVRHWDHWLDDRRVSLWVQEARAGAVPRNLLARSRFLEDPARAGGQDNDGPAMDTAWTLDGRAVVFTADVGLDQAARAQVSTHLFEVPVTGGEPRQLTEGALSHGQPAFTPDGRALLCLASALNDKVYTVTRLVRYDWPSKGAGTVLTATLDRSVSRFAVPAEGDRIWFTYEHAGLEKLYSIPMAGGAVREEPSLPTGCIGSLHAGGTRLVGLWESAVSPAEVHAFTPEGPKALSRFNAEAVAKLGLQPLESFWFTAKNGRRIHSLFLKPRGIDPAKRYPLFVVIHGGAASMWRDAFVLRWNYHLLGSPGYGVLLTDYTGSTGYGAAHAQAIQFDPLKGPAEELNQAADEALRRYPWLDPARQAAAGASYGGHLANWLQATTTRYQAIVSHAGEMDLVMQWGTSDGIFHRELNSGSPVWGASKVWREQSPVLQGGNAAKGTGFKTPILLTQGELDYRVPVNNALMAFATQQRLGVPSRLIVFPDEHHWVLKGENSRWWYQEVHAWLARWLR